MSCITQAGEELVVMHLVLFSDLGATPHAIVVGRWVRLTASLYCIFVHVLCESR
jgi:hypothetical protein